jgi:hypothetical protein
MTISIIPTSTKDSNYRQRTVLDGVEYELLFRWNQRESKWYMEIYDTEGTLVSAARKVTVDNLQSLPAAGYKVTASGNVRNYGILLPLDMTGLGNEPGLRDLGDRVLYFYIDSDSTE